MFEPNCLGTLKPLVGRDVHSRPTYGPAVDCPFGPVNLDVGALKTNVRADSSASRGAADETEAIRAKILVASYIDVKVGDRFEFDGLIFMITTKHTRRSVMGNVDHYECDMDLLPA